MRMARWNAVAAFIAPAVLLAMGATSARAQEEPPEAQPAQPPAEARQNEAQDRDGQREEGARPRDATRDDQQRRDGVQPRERRPDGRRETGERAERDQQGRRQRYDLGFQVDGRGDQGLTVGSVQQDGPAAQSGLRQNDRIVSVDGRQMRNSRQLQSYLASQGGRPVPIIIEREGRQYTVTFTPPEVAQNAAWVGIFLEEGEGDPRGARITHVYPAGPAARAGLFPGDVVTHVADQAVENASDLIAVVQEQEPRSQVEFVVLRNDQETRIPVTLGERRAFAYRAWSQDGREDWQRNDRDLGEFDPWESVHPMAMRLEHDRRNAEQHQRIEEEIRLLREEIQKLREALERR